MGALFLSEKDVSRYNKWVCTINNIAYAPYITVRKVNKFGRRHCLWCDIQKRMIHLLSDGERRAYEILMSRPSTVSVFEQFALDINETISIAETLGFVHPRDHRTNKLNVMTTDFLVVTQTENTPGAVVRKKTAYTFKYSSELYTDSSCKTFLSSATRTLQKLEIEQQYWNRRGIEYRVITELHATKERSWNIQFCKIGLKGAVDKDLAVDFSAVFYDIWERNRYMYFSDLINQSALTLGIDQLVAEQLFYFCVLHEMVNLVHSSKLQKYRPIELE
jgi:hypothetical protein